MMLFDTPTRDLCTVQRERTSTPLQALVLLNDPQYLEASKALAYRAIMEAEATPEAVIRYMFQLATSRAILEDELTALVRLYETEFQHYQDNPQAAEALLKFGEFDTSQAESDEMLAAYSYVANTIFNLDETIRK